MSYELFLSKAARLPSPQITIRKGVIALNSRSGDILASIGMRFVHLLWDVNALKIAIRPRENADGNTFMISFPKGKRGGTIAAQSFLNHIQWSATTAVTLDACWNGPEGLLEATLPKKHLGKMGGT